VSLRPAAALALLLVPAALPAQREPPRPVVVASKPFGESYLLAELFAQLLEARGIAVERRPGLGATEIAFAALRAGAIDVYPEYTGTGLLAILGEAPDPDPGAVYARVVREFQDRFRVRWLPPLGFQNTYAIAVRRETARRLGLATLSDLARVGPTLRAGLTPDFIGRADGLPGLERAYGLRFASVRALLPAVKYQALAADKVDVIDGYSTDGLIARYDLVVLQDDRRFFPPYEASALVGPALAEQNPAAVAALTELSGRLDEDRMRRLNRRVEVDREPVARVAADELRALGLVAAGRQRSAPASDAARAPARTRLWRYLWE
jgi:osmoprotectant transport system permease protein